MGVLDLSGNNLTYLGEQDAGVLASLERLRSLDLSRSHVRNISRAFLDGMPHPNLVLVRLDISDNELQTLPEGFRKWTQNVTDLRMRGNPFQCVCANLWMGQWLRAVVSAEFLPFDRCLHLSNHQTSKIKNI